jgi:hypothetical protein
LECESLRGKFFFIAKAAEPQPAKAGGHRITGETHLHAEPYDMPRRFAEDDLRWNGRGVSGFHVQ